jgi:hypothetical protein
MRQRVALMRTLAFHKDVMLLDEPFGALDSQTRLRMQQWLLDVWQDQGRTILFITHDVDEAIFLSDRVHVMSARPGHIRATFEIGLERPRGFELLTSDEFTELKREILGLIYSETLRQLERRGGGVKRLRGSLQIVLPLALTAVFGARDVVVRASTSSRTSCLPPVLFAQIHTDRDVLQPALFQTVEEFVLGFLVGVARFLLAIAMSQSRILHRGLYPLLIATQAVPIAIAAALVIWLGLA